MRLSHVDEGFPHLGRAELIRQNVCLLIVHESVNRAVSCETIARNGLMTDRRKGAEVVIDAPQFAQECEIDLSAGS
jgi:hypothetical protein